jgi:hypothetical protein
MAVLSILSVSALAVAPLVAAAPAEASPTCTFTYNSSQFSGHCVYTGMNPQPTGYFYYTFTLCGGSGSCSTVSTPHAPYGGYSVWNFSSGSGYGGNALAHTFQG